MHLRKINNHLHVIPVFFPILKSYKPHKNLIAKQAPAPGQADRIIIPFQQTQVDKLLYFSRMDIHEPASKPEFEVFVRYAGLHQSEIVDHVIGEVVLLGLLMQVDGCRRAGKF